MGKNKKTIFDIQKALLSNTEFIKEQEPQAEQVPYVPEIPQPRPVDCVVLDPALLRKLKILAAYEKQTPDELVNSALNHFLRLKAGRLDEAMRNLTGE